LCLVEKEVDLEAIEKTGKFKGLYFVLGGTISGLEKEKEKERIEERVEKLENRIKENSEIKELILALNPTTEGQSTALWLQRKLKNLGIKITQLGRGLPVGGELEYADEETLSSALESRK
jgi:recombination protein RecR